MVFPVYLFAGMSVNVLSEAGRSVVFLSSEVLCSSELFLCDSTRRVVEVKDTWTASKNF